MTRLKPPVISDPDPCLYGHAWCVGGPAEHGACESPLTTCFVPGFTHPAPILDAQLADWGGGAVISFSGDGHNGTSVTPGQLRAAVADISAHLPRLLALANQYEALTAAAVTR